MERPGSGHAYGGLLAREMNNRETPNRKGLISVASGCVMHLQITQLEVSSTGIRRMLKHDRSPRFLLPDSVSDYICENGLYADG
jgi:nicotinate-nucleotide adenylyltransferase